MIFAHLRPVAPPASQPPTPVIHKLRGFPPHFTHEYGSLALRLPKAAPSRPRREIKAPALRPLFRLWPLALLCPAALGAASDPIETVGKVATEWVKTRAETVRLENDWAAQKELLESAVNALSERAARLEDERDNLLAKTAKDRGELETLQARNKTAAEGVKAVEARLKAVSESLVKLRPSFPPRLSAALEMSYRSLANDDLTLAERMQLTMTVLNRCVQFNRTVVGGEEVLTIDGEGGAKSFEVLYWGLSHGYALDRAGGKAWFGSPGPQGWHWEVSPQAVRPVTELLTIYHDKAEPEFLAVPARLSHPPPAAPHP